MDVDGLLSKVKDGFATLEVNEDVCNDALDNLKYWLTDELFVDYRQQLNHLIGAEQWDVLLDSFYQVIPFGTGGRRGLVGIGPNRINQYTIESSAQGHSQYLLEKFGNAAKERGVVLSFDVRVFTDTAIYDESINNPIADLSCKDLAEAAARVYTANGIKVFLFDGPRSTPELSFAIRHLKTVSGDMFSASHNPPTDNGKKVYDAFGGQLVPPHDQELVDEVTKNVSKIKRLAIDKAKNEGLIEIIGAEVDEAYVQAVLAQSLNDSRYLDVLYSPLHGTGLTSVYEVLKGAGFSVTLDSATKNMSGAFENVTFNIPNPEVQASYDTLLKEAQNHPYDLLINTDPDADRVGVMVRHDGQYVFLNGNEIGIVLSRFALQKRKDSGNLTGKEVIVKTIVTTSLIERVAENYGATCEGDLLVGFKYIGEIMNRLADENRINDFVLGTEESHGFLSGDYARDKDAALPALWLCELASELKKDGKTIVDYLRQTYSEFGYCLSYLTEIRLSGAAGVKRIKDVMSFLRQRTPESFGEFKVLKKVDYLDKTPFVSRTDKSSKNVLVFFLEAQGTSQLKVTVRPSGTEPKVKFYIEVLGEPFDLADLDSVKKSLVAVQVAVERAVMKTSYKSIGVDFPQRGFLLFWQLPLDAKMHYFAIEDELASLKDVAEKEERLKRAANLLSFLGKDALKKVDDAFKARFDKKVSEYIGLD